MQYGRPNLTIKLEAFQKLSVTREEHGTAVKKREAVEVSASFCIH